MFSKRIILSLFLLVFLQNGFAVTDSSGIAPVAQTAWLQTYVGGTMMYPDPSKLVTSNGCTGQRTRDASPLLPLTSTNPNPYLPVFTPIIAPKDGRYIAVVWMYACKDQAGAFTAYILINKASDIDEIRTAADFPDSTRWWVAGSDNFSIPYGGIWLNNVNHPDSFSLKKGDAVGAVLYINSYSNQAMIFVTGWMKLYYIGP